MNDSSPFKVVRLTPPGRGAVASILLYGERANEVFAQHWLGPDLDKNRPIFGRFRLGNTGQYEETIVHQVAENEIEIHCHGGELVVAAVELTLTQSGAESVPWQDFFCGGNSQKELALQLLPFAPTERTAQILLDQYNGAVERELQAIEQLTDPSERRQHRQRLEESVSLGKHLVEPFRVVLAGASNVGKSSLLNAVLGFNRSIVHAAAGTTRDVVSGQAALQGFPVTFYDTAGFRETEDDLERQGIERSTQTLTDTDLIVWLMDSTVAETEQPAIPKGNNVLVCYNKMDSPDSRLPSGAVGISALTGFGIEPLLDMVIQRLVPHFPEPMEAVML
jgi:tRNA modification GTPase